MTNPRTPQKYYVPELDMEIKLERISTIVSVAHYPSGPERVRECDIHKGNWKHLGKWEDKEQDTPKG